MMSLPDPVSLSVLVVDASECDRQVLVQCLNQLPQPIEVIAVPDYDRALELGSHLFFTCLFVAPHLNDLTDFDRIHQLHQQNPESSLIILVSDPHTSIPLKWVQFLGSLRVLDYYVKSEIDIATLNSLVSRILAQPHKTQQDPFYQILQTQYEALQQKNRELEAQQRAIQVQNDEIRETARLKSEFLAMMSHELKTPMNAVIGFSQILLKQSRGPLNSYQVDMTQRILNNSRHLLTLLNDILDLSKIEAGRLELKPRLFDLAQLAESVVKELQDMAVQKELNLHLNVSLVQTTVLHDGQRIRQILINLLSNAIKFTEKGEIFVLLHEVDPDVIEILVQDTGIGILPNQLPHIFEAFRQADQTDTRPYKGTGLGLALVHALVRLMKGSICVSTQYGVGSTFQVQLPRQVHATVVII